MQYRSLSRQTAPAVEPVTLAEAKSHLRVDTSDDDTYIGTLIKAAREWVEEYLDRSLVHTQWVVRFDRFPYNGTDDLELPRPPVVASGTATTVSLTYTLESGGTATLSTASYRVDRNATPGAIKTLYGGSWPSHLDDDNSVAVTYWAGYGTAGSDVPQGIRNAMLMYVHEMYEKRGNAEPPAAAKMLLDAYRWGSYR